MNCYTAIQRLGARPNKPRPHSHGYGFDLHRWPMSTVRDKLGQDVEMTLDRGVKKDDVFALVQIKRRGDKQSAEPVEWAVVQVKEIDANGVCDCKLFHRRTSPFGDATVAGCRCLKLHTIPASLHMLLG